MAEFLNNLLFFIIAIGVLVTFHEFGHYWVARKLGVKVLRFSVGFGKPFYVYKRKVGVQQDEVEFALAAIPLGGYVKMLDERVEAVDEAEKHRAFNTQSLAVRSAIVFAGPLFNFILAIILYWAVFVVGVSAVQPVIDEPAAGTLAAKAGFQLEDKILSVNDEPVQTMTGFRLTLMEAALEGGDVRIQVIDQNQREQERILAVGENKILKAEGDAVSKMGFELWNPAIPADIGQTVKGSVAEQAGIIADDRIIAVNSQPVTSWKEAVEHISSNPGRPITITVLRSGDEVTINITPSVRKDSAGKEEGHIGVYLKRPDWIYERLYTKEIYSPVDAVGEAVAKTWNMSVLTLKVLGRMIIGEAALENISGPISIAQFAGATAGIGIIQFLSFLAVISVSLGVLNLLPVPVLDGGHLLFYLIELVLGHPLSERAQQYGQQIGMALLLMLMTIAIFNDLQRLFS